MLCNVSTTYALWKWRNHIINGIEENVVINVHAKNRNESDFGNKTLVFNEDFNWKFGAYSNTYYMMEIWWNSKYEIFGVYDHHVVSKCFNGNVFVVQKCFWLIRPDGFYLSKENNPFPDKWDFKKPWST